MLIFRPICDALLDHELLSYNASLMWTKTFQLMRKIIGGVDYKVLDIVSEFISCSCSYSNKMKLNILRSH